MFTVDHGDGVRSCSRDWVEFEARSGCLEDTLQLEAGDSDEEALVRFPLGNQVGYLVRLSALDASLDAVRSGFATELTVGVEFSGLVTSLRIEVGPDDGEVTFKADGNRCGWSFQLGALEGALRVLAGDFA